MRIIAGAAKGRRLGGPPAGTRPTSERAREGLFNSVATVLDLDGASVLDLYAGTGAVGLEALSRGAARAVLVESGRRATAVLERNIASVGLSGAELVASSVAGYLSSASASGFDLVFADPPYALADDDLRAALSLLAAHGWLGDGALLVVERDSRAPEPTWPVGVTSRQSRRYGDGVLWYGRRR